MTVKYEISENTYNESLNLNHDDLAEKFCTTSEIYGYGVYSIKVFKDNDKYFVTYYKGDSCD